MKLTLAAPQGTSLSVDYNHLISSLIYQTLGSVANHFATNLHDEGYSANGRKFKLFTFSRLQTRHAVLNGNQLVLKHSEVELQISSPVSEFIRHLAKGFSDAGVVSIGDAAFRLKALDYVPPPLFQEQMHFRALSPITEAFSREGQPDRFLSLTDDWSELIANNLVGKYKALHGTEPDDQRLTWKWDAAYIADAERRGKRLSVLKQIHNINVRGWLAPFSVEGNPALIELGYEAGFGSRNSMGFGMCEVAG